MLFDKKKAASIILGKMNKDGSSEHSYSGGGVVENVDHDFKGLHHAAQQMVDAIHSKSAMDMHKALSSYLEQHKQLQPGEKPDDKPSQNEKGTEAGHQYGMQK